MAELKTIAHCDTCNKDFDVTNMNFCDYDEYPMVLDVQMKDPNDQEEAMRIASRMYDFNDGEEMYHDSRTPDMSHEEPGASEHNLIGLTGGHWSFA